MSRHLTTGLHLRALENQGDKEETPEKPKRVKMEVEEAVNDDVEEEDEEVDFGLEENDDFLNDFCNDKFETEPTKDELAEIKKEASLLREKGKLEVLKQREANKFKKGKKDEEETDEVFI